MGFPKDPKKSLTLKSLIENICKPETKKFVESSKNKFVSDYEVSQVVQELAGNMKAIAATQFESAVSKSILQRLIAKWTGRKIRKDLLKGAADLITTLTLGKRGKLVRGREEEDEENDEQENVLTIKKFKKKIQKLFRSKKYLSENEKSFRNSLKDEHEETLNKLFPEFLKP